MIVTLAEPASDTAARTAPNAKERRLPPPFPDYAPFRPMHDSSGETAHAANTMRHRFTTDQSRRYDYVPI